MSWDNLVKLVHLARFGNGQDWKKVAADDGEFPVYGSGGQFGWASEFLHDGEAILFGRKGTVDHPIYVDGKFWTVDTMYYAVPNTDRCRGKYLYYWATTIPFKTIATNTALPSVTSMDLSQLYVPLPPLETQQRIADYLDRETAEIDAAVADLDKYVELLRVKLEITGQKIVADLLDDHPLTQVKFLVDITTGSGDTQDAKVEGEFPFYVRSDALQWSSEYEFDCDAVLTSGDGAGVGKIFHLASGKFKAHQRVYVMHNFRKVSPTYFYWVFRTTFPNAIRYGGAKSTVDSVRMPMIANLRIPVPAPRIQEKICEQFAELEQEITQLITDATKLRDLLIKRRSVLITEVVTGRKQV